MKAIIQYKALPADDISSLLDTDIAIPQINDNDLLVNVDAISVNPADTRVRMRKQDDGTHTVLGWDVAGTVIKTGKNAKSFSIDDKIWYAGDLTRAGCNSEFHVVDHRLVSLRPTNLLPAEAAAMPLTLLTAWETIFNRLNIRENDTEQEQTLLIIGAAGGAGSASIQIAKLIPNIQVIATASRASSIEWCKKNGADIVINHHEALLPQLRQHNIDEVDYVMVLSTPDHYMPQVAEIIKPLGKLCSIVPFAAPIDINILMYKSITFCWEFMFTHSMYHTPHLSSQGDILRKCKALFETGQLKTTVTETLSPINAENIRIAHQKIESGQMIGKLTLKN